MTDFWAMFWKEALELVAVPHTGAGTIVSLIATPHGRMAIYVLAVVWITLGSLGSGGLPVGGMLLWLVMMPILFVSTMVADAFAGERERQYPGNPAGHPTSGPGHLPR